MDEKLKQILTLTPRPEEAKTLGCRILLREIDVCGRDTVDGSKLYLLTQIVGAVIDDLSTNPRRHASR
ncbi:MAG: hypothetical protein QXX81_07700 [Zestosphaera sp.]